VSPAALLTAGHTFFHNDVDRALALQVPLIFNCQSKFVCANLKACYSGNAAVGILQLDTIWAPNQGRRGSVQTMGASLTPNRRLKPKQSLWGCRQTVAWKYRVHDKEQNYFLQLQQDNQKSRCSIQNKKPVISGGLAF